ncbi:MAG: enoyl-CoA hydratase/isomerase family protein [Gammaproteobacteria bacterium]|nr:enoyl-CoA hydratase/isomerase family protein [Gammaproteobacteria bacterium]
MVGERFGTAAVSGEGPMSYQFILTEQRGRVAIVKLNRPERLNALSYPLVYELYDAFERFNADPSVGVIILTGEGRAFCAGLDVQEWQNPEPPASGEPMNYRSQLRWLEMMRRSKPVVVAVNGLAVGGGITVILSCDLRIASDQAQFEERSVHLAEEIAAHPTSSLLATKQLVWDNMCEPDGEKVLRRETEVEERLMKGPDFAEATRAFIEKRPPRFNT